MSECRFEAQAELLEREFYRGIDRELIVEVQDTSNSTLMKAHR